MHALGSWCERYRSGTGARQSDRSGLWIKTRSALRLYFTRSAPRSLHAPLRSHALDHAHIFWSCEKIQSFWDDVQVVMSEVLGYRIPRTSLFLLMGNIKGIVPKSDLYLCICIYVYVFFLWHVKRL